MAGPDRPRGVLVVRPAQPDDAGAIAAIYNEGIRGRGATFETRERSADDILRWLDDPRFPVLVGEIEGVVVGWASSSSYRSRECYAGIAECSLYVASSARGQGVGSRLMPALLAALEARGFWKTLSRLFPENAASRAMCARHGFREVGTYRNHAQLDGVWRDVIIVERLLGAAERAASSA